MSNTPPPPPPPESSYSAPQVPPAAPRPAELLDRFLARLIDGVILWVVNLVIVTFIIVGALMGRSVGFTGGGGYAAAVVSAIVTAAIYLGYFAYMESSQGRSVGKMVMKLRVVGPDGGNPTLEQAARRNIWMAFGLLGIIPVIGGLLGFVAGLVAVIVIAVGINNDTVSRQGWHDHFAGETRVVKEG